MSDVVLLDGGMGQELIRRSGNPPTPFWGGQILMDMPAVVRDLHVDFIQAGAKVIATNNYSITPQKLEKFNLGDQFGTLLKRSVDIADEGIETAGVEGVRKAGCLPPLVLSYRPDLTPPFEEALESYRRIAEQLADGVDVFLCETMSSIDEVRAATQAASETGKPVWTAMSLSDDVHGVLRSMEPINEGVSAALASGAQALLFNCSSPEVISDSLPDLIRDGQGPTGAYANGFVSIKGLEPGGTVAALSAREDLGPETYGEIALDWVNKGAKIVGGCCEVGPAHIAHLAKRLVAEGHHITGDLNG